MLIMIPMDIDLGKYLQKIIINLHEMKELLK